MNEGLLAMLCSDGTLRPDSACTSGADVTYEVALVYREGDRTVLARAVAQGELESFVSSALVFAEQESINGRVPAVLLTREDAMPKTWAQHKADIIDVKEGIDKNDKPFTRRSMRFFKMGMGDWDRLEKMNSWRPKPKKVEKIDSWVDMVRCRNNDELCMCVVLDSRCRLEGERRTTSSRREGTNGVPPR